MASDADPADGACQFLKADINGHPAAASAVRDAPHDRNDPRVIPGKDGFDVGRADIPLPQPLGGCQIKGQVAHDILAGGAPVLRPAVQQCAVLVIDGDGGDFRAGGQQRCQKGVAGGFFVTEMFLDDADSALQRVHIAAHRTHDLTDRLRTARAGRFNNAAAIAAQKQHSA